MKYFVTGATGFLGGALVAQLRQSGHEVVALVRNAAAAESLRNLGVQLVSGDVTSKDSMREAMRGVDGVFHVAGWYKLGGKNRSAGEQVNVQGTRNVLELLEELKVPKLVYTSTLAVNSDTHGKAVDETYHFSGTHLSEYDRTKAAAHQLAQAAIGKGLPVVVLMPGLIYGPNGTSSSDKAIRQLRQGKLPMIPSKAAYSWGHVDDIAHAHILAMDKAKPGSTYMICGENHTLEEAFRIGSRVFGVKMPMVVPPWMLSVSSVMVKPLELLFAMPEMYSSEALKVQAGVTYLGNNALARQELGYNPRSLEQGFADLAAAEKI